MKRSIISAAAILASAALLAGCGSSTTAATEAVKTQETEAAASGKEVLRVGMECNYAPFNWTTTETNDFTQPITGVDYADGYDVVMATKLAGSIGRDVQIVKLDWDNLILSLQNDQIDAIIAGMTDTPEREKEVAFTSPYYESEEVMIVKADSKYAGASSIQDFSGATVQGQMNTVYDEVIDQIEGVVHQPAAETFPASIQALQAGAIDAVVSELPVANGVVAANSGLAIVRFEEGKGFTADTTVSVAVRKEDTELKDQLEKALSEISADERNSLMEAAVERQPANG
ncbi:transporter substrate-binding domain-containing protein [Oribacterium sp. P6A1]|uniref:transporter substrate-binding domain-containing protein n=1 Tax=Oribacterium sp. P6A1 TaxID=1410612 RepID=UPI00056AADEC|nr:transporter substrate-binding domain-containing protein [Oribacterium sp. P6A1]